MLPAAMRPALAGLALIASVVSAAAQDYPNRAVKIIAPFSAGGAVDLGARNLADGLSKLWNQSVVVENMPGAGSQLGTGAVAESAPDGYTLLYVSGAFATLPALRANLPYDPKADFIPITATGEGLFVIAAGPKVQSATFKDFVEESKTRKGFYATSGAGGSGHMISEALNLVTGMELEPVHFKGGGEATLDVAAGRVDVYIGVLPALLPLMQDGKVRILATFGSERVASLPDVPTLKELGYQNAELSVWWGLFAPAGTPEAIVNKLNQDVATVLTKPEHAAFLKQSESAFVPRTPAEFAAFVDRETVFWKEVVAARGIAE